MKINCFEAKDKGELEQLRAVVAQQTTDINGTIHDEAALPEARRTLETKHRRLAELEQLERISRVAQEAIRLGLLNHELTEDDVCPRCRDVIPHDKSRTVMLCCGAKVCSPCMDLHDQCVASLIHAANDAPDEAQFNLILQQIDTERCCPSCRFAFDTSMPSIENDVQTHVKYHAIVGRTWAQHAFGKILLYGNLGVMQDRVLGSMFLEQAAAAGNVDAMMDLRTLWEEEGLLEEANIPQSEEKANAYLFQAAKHGHSWAQYVVGEQAFQIGNIKDALTWYTISAALGCADAQFIMGHVNATGFYGVRKSIFAAIYWFEKAALNGNDDAKAQLAASLQEAKQMIFDDTGKNHGNPNATFWFGKMLTTYTNGVAIPKLQQFGSVITGGTTIGRSILRVLLYATNIPVEYVALLLWMVTWCIFFFFFLYPSLLPPPTHS